MEKLFPRPSRQDTKLSSSSGFVPMVINNTTLLCVSVNAEIPVGEFFWIKTCIGMADNASHGHGVRNEPNPGSADVNCTVRVLDVTDDDYATVVLQRPDTPYGALAPHGTIFLIPINVLEQWPNMTARRLWQEKTRANMRQDLGQIRV